MKNINKTLIAALAGIAMFTLGGPAQAQYKPTGTDGITASPKVRQMLNERKVSISLAVAAPMSCTRCKDVWSIRPNKEAKGAQALISDGIPTKAVASHLCVQCKNEWQVVGQGKAKQSITKHSCTRGGAKELACCVAVNSAPRVNK